MEPVYLHLYTPHLDCLPAGLACEYQNEIRLFGGREVENVNPSEIASSLASFLFDRMGQPFVTFLANVIMCLP